MPLPLIPVAIALAAAAGFGKKKVQEFQDAKGIKDDAVARHKRHVEILETARSHLQVRMEALQLQRQQVLQSVVMRLAALMEKVNQRSKVRDLINDDRIEGVPESLLRFEDFPSPEFGSLIKGAIAVVGAGSGAAAGTFGVVGALGVAGTGTPIAALSGAAATNATFAALGGGTLASGGMGIAGGMAVLGTVAAVPALIVGGVLLNSKLAKDKVKAEEFSNAVDEAVAKIDVMVQLLHRAELRVTELEDLTNKMAMRAAGAVDCLEEVAAEFDYDNGEHIARLRGAMLFSPALRKLIDCRVLDDEGRLDATSEQLILELSGMLQFAAEGGG